MTGGVLKKLEKSEKVRSKRYRENGYPKLVSRMTIAVTIGQSSLKTMNLKLNTVDQGLAKPFSRFKSWLSFC